jgi:type II secretory pathway pseudopilin PulG
MTTRFRATAAFTLLELIFVMVIICTVLAMAAPSLRSFASSRATADAAAQIVALTRYARTQAVAEGCIYRLNFDIEKGQYWLEAQELGAFANISSEFGRVFSLPEGTTASWVAPPPAPMVVAVPGLQLPGQGSVSEAQPSVRDFINFGPDGRTEAVRLRLTDRKQNALDIVCASATDSFLVTSASQEDSR